MEYYSIVHTSNILQTIVVEVLSSLYIISVIIITGHKVELSSELSRSRPVSRNARKVEN